MFEEIKFDESMKPLDKFYIHGKTFEIKDKLQAWGCYWVAEKKAWCYEGSSHDVFFKVIESNYRGLSVIKE